MLPECLKWIDGQLDGYDLFCGAIALLDRADPVMQKIARVATTLFLSLERDTSSSRSPIRFNTNIPGSTTGSNAFKAALRDLLSISTNVEETTGDALSEGVGVHLCGNATRVAYGTLLLEYGQATARREQIILAVKIGCAKLIAGGVPREVVFGGANGDLICSILSAVLDLALAEHSSRTSICTQAWQSIPLEDALLYRGGGGTGIGWARHIEHCRVGKAKNCEKHMTYIGILTAALDATDIEKDHGSTFDNIPAAYPGLDFQGKLHQLAKDGHCVGVTISFIGALLWQYFAHSHSSYTPRSLLIQYLESLKPETVVDGVSSRRATVELLEKGYLQGYSGPLGLPATLDVGSLTYIWDEERLYYRPSDFKPKPFESKFVDGWEERKKRALARFDTTDTEEEVPEVPTDYSQK
jgi:hypothetical protein